MKYYKQTHSCNRTKISYPILNSKQKLYIQWEEDPDDMLTLTKILSEISFLSDKKVDLIFPRLLHAYFRNRRGDCN